MLFYLITSVIESRGSDSQKIPTARDKANILSFSLIFFFFFLPCCVVYGILVPPPGIEPMPLALEVWTFNLWTTRGALKLAFCCMTYKILVDK